MVSEGSPDLIAMIEKEIQTQGPLTFARFMELALYEPTHGYYMDAHMAKNRIGWEGDFFTSSDLHPFFAKAFATQAQQMDAVFGHPHTLTFVEMGPGKGLFAQHFLKACQNIGGSFWNRLRYVLIERSPALQAQQTLSVAAWVGETDKVRWARTLADLDLASLTGIVFSNELVDAFPVHRVKAQNGQLQEIFVDRQDGQLCDKLGTPSTDELSQYFNRLDISLTDNYCTEVNLEAMKWIKGVADVLEKGCVITVDYGHTAHDLYSPERKRGTLLCYYQHQISENPYRHIGYQDMTSHVDFSSLALEGRTWDLFVTGFTNHMSFLASMGIEKELASVDPESKEAQALAQLLRPDGMGKTFKILIQHKGMERPELAGLRYKPFFESALTGHTAQQN